MRFATYSNPAGVERAGLVDGDRVAPVAGAKRLIDVLAAPGSACTAEGDWLALTDVDLRAPVPQPPSVRDFMAFEAHVEGTMLLQGPTATVPEVWYRQPVFYFSNPAGIVGPFDDVPMPPGCRLLDFELEVAAIVGRSGSNLTLEEAEEAIAGYTIMNDWSARDLQGREMRASLGPAKGKDFATTLGPFLVTPDELDPELSLRMEVELNGEPFGADSLANMAWSFPQLVAHASRGTRLVPGDVIGSGTCGSGCIAEMWGRRGRDAQRMLEPGDVVTMRVEGLGEIRNRVVPGPEPVELGGPRSR